MANNFLLVMHLDKCLEKVVIMLQERLKSVWIKEVLEEVINFIVIEITESCCLKVTIIDMFYFSSAVSILLSQIF